MFQVAESLQVLGLFDPSKKTENASTNGKRRESSSKKRKRWHKAVEGEDSQSSGGTLLDEGTTADSSMDVMVDPTDWLQMSHNVDTVQGAGAINSVS